MQLVVPSVVRIAVMFQSCITHWNYQYHVLELTVPPMGTVSSICMCCYETRFVSEC